MFDVFGNFNSSEEINKTAEGLLNEGNIENIYVLAKENGIDKEDAQDYIDGNVDELCNPLMAAFGKLQVETEDLNPYEIMNDWIEYIKSRCSESDDVVRAVRRADKSLKGCMGALLKWSFNNMQEVNQDIVKETGVKLHYPIKLGIPSMARVKQIISEYYLS